MRRLISSDGMAQIDIKAQKDFKIPGIVLMENAGALGWKYIEDFVNPDSTSGSLVFVAGGGNNGGDALVMARHAFQHFNSRVKVIFSGNTPNENSRLQAQIIDKLKIENYIWPEQPMSVTNILESADLIVDGISGTGLKGSLRGRSVDLVLLLNKIKSFKVAIDIPSGVSENLEPGYPYFKADLTLTMGLEKFSLYTPAGRMACGSIKVINPGFPRVLLDDTGSISEDFIYTFADFTLPEVPANFYKNKRGHVGVFAGSKGFSGAAILSSLAAGRVRTGLVTLHVDKEIYIPAASSLKSVMVRTLDEEITEDYPMHFTSFLIGPGWGVEGRAEVLEKLINSRLPGVVDADGILILAKYLKESRRKLFGGNIVITPHPGEFSLFTGVAKDKIEANPFPLLRKVSREFGVVILLKSHVNYIASPDGKVALVDGMNPSLGVGGSGDILAGIVAGFMAQGMGAFDSALNGALAHQRAGEACFDEHGWFLAEDLLPFLSNIVKETKKSAFPGATSER